SEVDPLSLLLAKFGIVTVLIHISSSDAVRPSLHVHGDRLPMALGISAPTLKPRSALANIQALPREHPRLLARLSHATLSIRRPTAGGSLPMGLVPPCSARRL